ncbi:MAG TPA: hemolysin [Cytophagales bacterium]|nr:hemolysin [Cytophagales bacterium]HAA23379.1 hemolysin [Cytophagales bacterium]HAP58141.1 hemolysin [Cytophagales bacterium]
MDPTLTVIIVSLVLSALFSGIEIAFVSSDKLQIELQRQKGHWAGKVLSTFLQQPSRFIVTTLIGNTIALVIYGSFMASAIDPWLATHLPPFLQGGISRLVIQTILSTLLVLVVAEFTPKSVFLLNPNGLLNRLAFVVRFFYLLFWPFVRVVVWLSRVLIEKGFRLNYAESQPVFGLTDLNVFISSNVQARTESGDNVEVNSKIFSNALEFKTVRVRECLVPRNEMVAVDESDDIEVLREAFIESGHSKVLVYREHIDNIVGYCHSLKLFRKPQAIVDIINPITYVPETALANELLVQLITEHKSVALVVDEFGGTSGIVTVEDLIEEIFGEIQDEHDDEDWVEQQLDELNWLLSARHEIDYLNEKYHWELPEGDYDTLSGLILSVHEDIPQIGEVIRMDRMVFTVESIQETRIDTVKLTWLEPLPAVE